MTSLADHLNERVRRFATANSPVKETQALVIHLQQICTDVISHPQDFVEAHDRLVAQLTDSEQAVAISILALFVLNSQKVNARSFSNTNPNELVNLAEALLPRWRTTVEAIKAFDGFAQMEKSQESFARFLDNFHKFQTAIAPRKVLSVLKDATTFQERFSTFVDRATLDDSKIEAAAQTYCKERGLLQADVERLLKKTPTACLRTYSDAQLQTIVNNFYQFDMLVRFLEYKQSIRADVEAGIGQSDVFDKFLDQLRESYQASRDTEKENLIDEYRQGGSKDPNEWATEINCVARIIENALEDEWLQQHKLMVRILAGRARKSFPNVDSQRLEEACHEALNSAVTKLKGYSYEGNFYGWLISTASNLMRVWLRNFNQETDVDQQFKSSSTLEGDFLDQVEWFQEWRLRYLLVESFFLPRLWPSIKAIFVAMLTSPDGMLDYVGLADEIEQETGERPENNVLYLRTYRFRQRQLVLRHLLDNTPQGQSNQTGDEGMLAYIKTECGYAPNDVSTLRHLAALTRATQGESLGWAIIVRGLIDKKGRLATEPNQSCEEWLHLVAESLELNHKGASAQNFLARAAFAFHRMTKHQPLIQQVRQMLAANKVECFLSACWYLAVVNEISATQANDVLRPAPQEAVWVAEAVTRLQSAEKGEPPMDDRTTRPTRKTSAGKQRLAPRDAIIAFLVGENLDRDQLVQAVNDLAATNPQQLEQLRRKLQTSSRLTTTFDPECDEVAESLSEYLRLGDQASDRMPDVYQHLQSCEQCASDLAALRAISVQPDNPLPETNKWLTEAGKSLVVLSKQGWKILGEQVSAVSLAINSDGANNRMVAIVESVQKRLVGDGSELVFGFPQDRQPPIAVRINLPGNIARINLEVTQEYLVTGHTSEWSMKLALDDSSLVQEIIIGLGNEESADFSKTVRVGAITKFPPVSPPSNGSYWLHCKWKARGNEVQTVKFELPLHMELTGGDQ